jgi:predicted permease
MREGGRRFTLRNALVVFQVAVSVLLLGGSSTFLQMLGASRAQRVGYAVDGVAMMQTDSRYTGYSSAEATRVSEELGRRVARLPGVQSAALTRGLAMEATGVPLRLEGDGAASEPAGAAGAIWAGPGYFDALRIPLLSGRTFDERDRAGGPRVAVINESMARRFFGGSDVLGRRFRVDRDPVEWFEVIGVVANTGTSDLSGDLVDPTPHLFYRSFVQAGLPPTTVLARTSLDATSLVGSMQRELRAIDGSLPVILAITMTRHLEDSLLVPKAIATLLAALGFAGMCLAAIGLYAVIAFGVSQRSREIGIRMALGAHGTQVVWSVSREVAMLVSVGTGVGLALSVLAIVGLRAVAEPAPGVSLYQPTPDPIALLAIAALMALAGIAAAYAPARRATRMDPVAAIRQD